MHIDKDISRGVAIWLSGSDKHLAAGGVSLGAARQMLRRETGIALSAAAFHRRVMYARTCGRLRWWCGHRRPLPANDWCGPAGITILFALNDLMRRVPELDLAHEDPAFVARLLCDDGFRVSPHDVEFLCGGL